MVLFNKRLFDNVRFYDIKSAKYLVLLPQVLSLANKIYVIDNEFYGYRNTPGLTLSKYTNQLKKEIPIAFKQLIDKDTDILNYLITRFIVNIIRGLDPRFRS
ncbi:hypothetical protein BCT54_04920 [Vibrio splendidus]|uniref:Uncharacterized protein n=1 Tax=Vibrio splendidus TaxID=29497 RepID=A0A2N7JP59_VIBSP|nr:hypothetical protein BCT54_04920 [Vibrio splendidus]